MNVVTRWLLAGHAVSAAGLVVALAVEELHDGDMLPRTGVRETVVVLL